jgi:hypothetical protein
MRRTSQQFQCADRRRERLLDILLEITSLQPAHQDCGEARRPSIGIALEPMHMAASGQVLRIGARHQSHECLVTHRIVDFHRTLHGRNYRDVTSIPLFGTVHRHTVTSLMIAAARHSSQCLNATDATATTGTARNIPATPANPAPASTATITASGCKEMPRRMRRG